MMDFMKVDKEFTRMNNQETTIIRKTIQVSRNLHYEKRLT